MKNSQDILSPSNKTKAMWDIVKNTITSSRYLVENVILKDNERERVIRKSCQSLQQTLFQNCV